MPATKPPTVERNANRSGAGRLLHDGAGTHAGAEDGHLKSRVIKRSLVVGGHKTSVSLEDVFWNDLRSIAESRKLNLSKLVASIDANRQHCNLSSAIRLFVFENNRDRREEEPQAPSTNEPGKASVRR